MMALLEDLVGAMEEAAMELVSCPVLAGAAELDDAGFHHLLLQRRFVSLAFTPFYDATIDSLDSATARLVCRQVLREEYPDVAGNVPSHRESLVQDLVTLGVERATVLTARPTPATGVAILAAHELVPVARSDPFPEVAVIATAACYAEVLVAAEYTALAPRIEKVVRLDETLFYGPHVNHDSGHARRLLAEVAGQMDLGNPDHRQTFSGAVERSLRVRLDFYRQFNDPAPA
jgi:hypothetical protein